MARSTDSDDSKGPSLHRVLGLPLLTAYGVGNLVGGGYYALMGKVAGLSGAFAPLAFLLAATIASFSALSFCELSARYPLSGGPASYVQSVFGRRSFATVIGILMVATGTISAATLACAVDGFVQDLMTHPEWLGIAAFIVVLAGVAIWGISESVLLAVGIAAIEVGGLVYVAIAASGADVATHQSPLELDALSSTGLLMGAFLSFYAFVGFEDLVTLAEEVKDPRRTLPRAVLLSLIITTVVYVLVTSLALRVVPAAELADSRAPISLVVERSGFPGGSLLIYVGVLAGINGALVQLVMGSRVIYRLSADSARPGLLGRVNRVTRTPILATIVVAALTLALALWLDVVALARATSFLLLIVFTVVNLALATIKRRGDSRVPGLPCYPLWVPVVGALLCVGFMLVELARVLGGLG